MKNIKLLGILAICSAFMTVSSYGQTTAPLATQQQQNFQNSMEMQKPLLTLRPGTNAPEIYQGENADIGEQHILRVLPRNTLFFVSASSQYLYINNALLTGHPYVSSTEFVNTLVAAFAPTPYRIGPGRFAPEIGYTGQWYDYGLGGNSQLTTGTPISSIDFNVQSAIAGGKYYFPNNWILSGGVNYNWFFQQNNSSMFYRELVPQLALERLIQVGDDAVFAISAGGDWHQSWQLNQTATQPHDLQNRADAQLSVSFAYQVAPKLVVEPYDRFQYTYYPKDTSGHAVRQDFLNSLGISAAWFFTPNLSLGVFMSEDAKQTASDTLAPDYHSWNAGVNLNFACRF